MRILTESEINQLCAEMLEKVFAPTFKAEDLHKQPNYHAIATVMMYDMPTAPFTMNLLPPMGEENPDVFASLKNYSATKYGRPIAEVEREINERMAVKKPTPKMSTEKAEELVNALPGEGKRVERPVVNEVTEEEEQILEQAQKRPSYLDKWKKPVPEPTPEAKEAAEEQLAALERKEKRERGKMNDGDVIKLH